MLLPDDVIYHILSFIIHHDHQTMLSFCMTSTKPWHQKHFWVQQFNMLPLKSKWVKRIEQRQVFKLIHHHRYLTTLYDYQHQLHDLTLLNHVIIKVDCQVVDSYRLDSAIRQLFVYTITSSDPIKSVQFLYNGYVWIWSYVTNDEKIYQHYNDNGYDKMMLFLYKMIKLNYPIRITFN